MLGLVWHAFPRFDGIRHRRMLLPASNSQELLQHLPRHTALARNVIRRGLVSGYHIGNGQNVESIYLVRVGLDGGLKVW
jgi:hypothetical protein